ncbi:MAG TPA: hypothetical protein VKR06_07030 [Ktedonosporobacter sp.]|nr:hypothetical protein [Ktedonosporobacter sp.]
MMRRMHYQIRVLGHLDPEWQDWFDGLTITHTEQGETVLTGMLVDQASLQGVIVRVYDLGLPLLEIRQVPANDSEKP